MHRVAADVVGRVLERHRLGQQAHTALGRRIGRKARRAAQAGHRRHQHDRAAAHPLHRRDRMLDREEHAVEIDRLLTLPVGESHGRDRRHDADAGIGHHDVEPAVLLLGVGDDAGPCRLVAHVMTQIVRLAARLGDAVDDTLSEDVVDVRYENRRAFARQRYGTGLADAGSTARDDGNLSRDLSHGTLLSGSSSCRGASRRTT